MRLKDNIESIISICKVKLLHKRIPLAVRIELTNRCPNKCSYCNLYNMNDIQPSKEEIFELLKGLRHLGTKRVSFSGGEPMLRKDIGEIINFTKSLGIYAEMNTSGFYVAERINEIKNLDLIKISLDGPQQVHDFITQRQGAFKDAIKAIQASTSYGIKTVITTTITKNNLKYFDYILDLAKKYNCFVAFQPVKKMFNSTDKIDKLFPPQEEYKKEIIKLIKLKLINGEIMRNSILGLKHIYNFPKYNKFRCAAGRLFIIVDVDGTVYPCDRTDYPYDKPLPNWKKNGIKKAIETLPEVNCNGCGFCGALELSYLLNFRFSVIKQIFTLVR
ncbi:MAG: radical SAM protein [Endomicrobia bacterium]|nr:radical SAM protein [Endomicrobiia bacterium]